ncbi:MAG: DUF4321 domain-containing protein [Porcipelethomonas sp.]
MKKKIILILLLVAALILGSAVGKGAAGIESLQWLGYSKSLSVSPFTVTIPVISLTFGFDLTINVAQIIMAVAAVIAYPKIVKLLNA